MFSSALTEVLVWYPKEMKHTEGICTCGWVSVSQYLRTSGYNVQYQLNLMGRNESKLSLM